MEGLFNYLRQHEIVINFIIDYWTLAIIAICIIINNILLFFSTEIKEHFKVKLMPFMATKIGFIKTESIFAKLINDFKKGLNKTRKK